MTENFIRMRINELRKQRGVSECQMGYDLGKSRSYIQNISSGRCMPLVKDLLMIIDYFGITPSEFFDEELFYSGLTLKAINGIKALSDEDLESLTGVIGRFCVLRGVIEDLTAGSTV